MTLPTLLPSASTASAQDINSVIAPKTRCWWAYWHTHVTLMASSLSTPTPPSFSASLSNSIQLNNTAKSLIPPSMHVHGAAPLTMESAHGSACEASTTSSPFLELPLAMAPYYRDWWPLALTPNLSVSTFYVYFNNLHFESSPYNNDSYYSKIVTPYSALQFKIFSTSDSYP